MADKNIPGSQTSGGVAAGPEGAGLFGGEQASEATAKPYVVLARKYRPQSFEDLIGQEAMVTTLRNAFSSDRIAQAYMLTGVRGVGKTTTARILARGLNYERLGQPGKPTTDMPELGVHCREIIESRHPDVLEMDAASNTGIDNIREIIESARYKPISARIKVFIIDEVHMLSKGAFNALLKTLEEPPPHVKFIFATTEVRRVPVTVLSRCQRFDLRRVEGPVLIKHFEKITTAEGATAESDALALIARAAEGSVRDGLSILDQAIAMGVGAVSVATVRAMLGLADRGRIFDLLDSLFRGDVKTALSGLGKMHADGAEPAAILTDLAAAVHAAARIKATGIEAASEGLSAEERKRAGALADGLSVALLSRAWQMLIKGLEELARAPNPLAAAEMVLIRLAYTADLPAPDELIRALGSGAAGAGGPRAPAPGDGRPAGRTLMSVPAGPQAGLAARHEPMAQVLPAPAATASPAFDAMPRTFDDVVALTSLRREVKLKIHLEEHVSLVRFEPGQLEIRLNEGAPQTLPNELAEKLSRWTGKRWVVAVSRESGQVPIGHIRREREANEIEQLKRHPAVQALLAVFPEAEIADVRHVEQEVTQPVDIEDEEDNDSATG